MPCYYVLLQLSQILGHSEQLFVKLPKGLRSWQLFLAIFHTFSALWVSPTSDLSDPSILLDKSNLHMNLTYGKSKLNFI